MRKKMIAILAAVAMLVSLFLFVGCNQPNGSDTGDNEDNENQGGGKPIISTRMWLNFEKKEFSTEEDVTVEFFYGTLNKQEFLDEHLSKVEFIAESYIGKPTTVNWYGTKEPDAEISLFTIEDFCFENYPLSTSEDFFSVETSTTVTLPKTLFVGTEGVIAIKMVPHIEVAAGLSYKLDGEKIMVEEDEGIFYRTEDIKLTEEDFRLSVSLDKENYQVGDKINVAVTLTNLSGKDVTVEIPDWIAALHNGKSMEDTVEFCFAPKGSDNAWKDTAFSVAVVPRPRTVFQKDATIERTFEYTVTEKQDLEMQISAIFYYGGEKEHRFNKQIVLKNEFEVAIAEE